MYIDVSAIIAICPAYLKISETSSNVLNIINQACDEAGSDFIITIIGNTFTAIPINKRVAPPSGALGTLLNTIAASSCNGDGTIDYRYGEETSYEPSKKLVLGENVHYLMTVSKDGECSGAPGTESGAPASNNPIIENPPPPPVTPPPGH
jgi:hypothetical protein